MDIAKRKHYACFVDDRGRILQKTFPVAQSNKALKGFTSASCQL